MQLFASALFGTEGTDENNGKKTLHKGRVGQQRGIRQSR